jgi:uncharacterized YccA/Bax inhibitor family protein
MANPVLTRTFGEEQATSTATADTAAASTPIMVAPGEARMELGGTIGKTGILLFIVIAFATWGWTLVDPAEGTTWPLWLTFAILGALLVGIVGLFMPRLAWLFGPIYTAAQGVVLGAISHVYSDAFEGIVLQALLATASIFMVMLVLFITRTIRVTERFRGVVIGATLGIALFYLVSIVMSLFGVQVPLVWDTGLLGIAFSAVVVIVAAFNLMLDFDLIERGIAMGAPSYMEWYAAWALMITMIWLYLEMLRLLGKLRS